MLKTILAITGKPGLFKIVSNGKNILLVEDITTHKRFPATGRDKIVSLGDIAIYTDAEEVPLAQVLDKAYTALQGKEIDIKPLSKEQLRDQFSQILPDYDRDRVYDSDIRKFFVWYNILLSAGITTFLPDAQTEGDPE